MSNSNVDFFTKEMAEGYDKRNSPLSPISDGLHFLMSLVLENLPANCRVLSVGAGTGAEILYLAKIFPSWTFVAVEPSESMLNICKERVHDAYLGDRCEFVHGYCSNLPKEASFDVALSILVAHFIAKSERASYFSEMTSRLKSGGYLINAEISIGIESNEFAPMLDVWESVQKRMGGTPESLKNLPQVLKEILTVLPNCETEQLLRTSGIPLPVKFYQAFMISAWYGVKQ